MLSGLTRAQPEMTVAVEAPFLDRETGKLLRSGKLNLPMRPDVSLLGAEGWTTLRAASGLTMTLNMRAGFKWGDDLPVFLRGPFLWENCAFRVETPAPAMNREPVVAWFEKWFNPEYLPAPVGAADATPGGAGVVHFLSDPKDVAGGVEFEADFGTAPIDAFLDLLDALREAGAGAVHFGGEPFYPVARAP